MTFVSMWVSLYWDKGIPYQAGRLEGRRIPEPLPDSAELPMQSLKRNIRDGQEENNLNRS